MKKIISFALVLMFALGLVGLTGAGKQAIAQEPIAIGSLQALTGSNAEMGKILLAANLAVEHINSAGGPLDRSLKLLLADTGSLPDQGVAAGKKLVNLDGVPAISGPVSSSVAMALAPTIVENEVLLVSPACTTPLLTVYEDKDFIFRTSSTDILQARALALLAREKGYKKVSIIARNDSYGSQLAKHLEISLKLAGLKVPQKVLYEPEQTSFKAELMKAAAGDPDRISMTAYPAEAVTIMKQAMDLGITNVGLFPDSTKSKEFVDNIAKAVGKDRVEGISGVAGATPSGLGAKRFNELFEEKHGHSAHPFAVNAYDSVYVIALAIHKAGSIRGPAIRDALREVANPPGEIVTVNEFGKAKELISKGIDINYEGASGAIDFDENGDTYAPVGVWQIKDASIVEVKVYTVDELEKFGK